MTTAQYLKLALFVLSGLVRQVVPYTTHYTHTPYTIHAGEFIEWYRQHGVAFLFRRFDDDSNGVLTVEEMPQLLECIGIKVDDNQVTDVLKLLDCDSSGGVSLAELQQWWTVFDAQQAFEVHDLSHDGAIDHRELRLLARELGVDMTLEEARMAVAALDVDHDSTLSYEEFLPWWMAFLVKNKQRTKRLTLSADRVSQLKLRSHALEDVQQMESLINQILEDEAKTADSDRSKHITSCGFSTELMLQKIEKATTLRKGAARKTNELNGDGGMNAGTARLGGVRQRAFSTEDDESLALIREQLAGAGVGTDLQGVGAGEEDSIDVIRRDSAQAAATALLAATAGGGSRRASKQHVGGGHGEDKGPLADDIDWDELLQQQTLQDAQRIPQSTPTATRPLHLTAGARGGPTIPTRKSTGSALDVAVLARRASKF
jgi:Ca2+-binding EF-hand superfamily protein